MKAPNDYADLLASDPTRKHTAPPAEHGLRDLGLGVLLCLLLLSLFPSCAPARLPLGTVARPVGHDSRTRVAEPAPSRIR